MRDDEPRPVWMSLPITLQALETVRNRLRGLLGGRSNVKGQHGAGRVLPHSIR
jgi:hypothetical protein